MRLIDADALNNLLGVSEMELFAKCWLDRMPTIEAEPVKHGRWIIEEDSIFEGEEKCSLVCSVCGRYVFNIINPKKAIEYRPYCHCGAKMDLEG